MAKYYVKMDIDARFTACIEADSTEDAKTKANIAFQKANFGDAEINDFKIMNIEDENGVYVYEN